MSWQFNNQAPIYSQIMNKIKQQIISGELQLGQKLTSVRELSEEAGVNPNTMQRALADLERDGFVFSVRTSGRFVTEDETLIQQTREQLANDRLITFDEDMKSLGFTNDEMIHLLTKYINSKGV